MTLRKGQRVTFRESYLSPIWTHEVQKGATGVIADVRREGESASEDVAPGIEVLLDQPLNLDGTEVRSVFFTRGLGGDGVSLYDDVEKIFRYYCEIQNSAKKGIRPQLA